MVLHVVASRCSQNHCISEKWKSLKPLELHLLQNSLFFFFLQLYNSASDCKVVFNIPGNDFVKTFLAVPLHFITMSVASQKRRPFSADFS
jgi:hypothetical protein